MIKEVEKLMKNENYDGLLDWAFYNDNKFSNKETLESVADAYECLIDKGYGIAANNLGSMYYCGRYFPEDVNEAIRYYEIACEMGTKMAWGNLGCCYFYGINKDYKKAFEVFAEGAFLFNDVECLYMLGEMYQYGYYVNKSNDKARHLYYKALNSVDSSDQRDYNCIGDIHHRIGKFLIEENINVKDGLKNLYLALGFLYEKIDDDKFAENNIKNIKALISETELLIDSDKSGFLA